MARDGLTEQEVALRFQAQNPPEKNAAKAGYIIDNDSSEDTLPEKVQFIDRIITLTYSPPS